MAVNLASIRDLLMPGLYAISGQAPPHLDMALHANYAADALELVIRDTRTGNSWRTDITRREIDDGSYLSTFSPRLRSGVEYFTGRPCDEGGPPDPTQFTLSELEQAQDLIDQLKDK